MGKKRSSMESKKRGVLTGALKGMGIVGIVFGVVFVLSALAATPEPVIKSIYGCGVLSEEGVTYLLQQDITHNEPLGDKTFFPCMRITANNVVFDGQGHTITQVFSCEQSSWLSFGAHITPTDDKTISNVEIRNVKIDGFGVGLAFENATGCIVDNVEIGDSFSGISFDSNSHDNTIKNSAFPCDLFDGMQHIDTGNNILQNNMIRCSEPTSGL